MKISTICPVPLELIAGTLGSGCQGSGIPGLLLALCDLQLRKPLCLLEPGVESQGTFSESGGL